MTVKLEEAHRRLLAEIERETADTRNWTGRETLSPAVIAAMAGVQRHEFMKPDEAGYAYVNRPQSIGFGQTISQPFIVAIMTELLDLSPDDRVLEVGTGSGYQTAVLAEISRQVFSIESIGKLAAPSSRRLRRLGYENIEVRHGDGHLGWPERAPFDAIMVTAAPRKIPRTLIDQLANGGRMIIPVGRPHEAQNLMLCTRDADGTVTEKGILPVAFVPMVESVKD